MRERISKITKYYKISGREFSRRIGKSESFSSAINETIGVDVANKIFNEFPEINPQWLITGAGEMLRPKPYAEISNLDKLADEAEKYQSGNTVNALLKSNQQLSETNNMLTETVKNLIAENAKLSKRIEELTAKLQSKGK